MLRNVVYKIIDSERDYQDAKWGKKENQVASWITYMRHYLNEAERQVTTNDNDEHALLNLRKVVALGVACFEEHGVYFREPNSYART